MMKLFMLFVFFVGLIDQRSVSGNTLGLYNRDSTRKSCSTNGECQPGEKCIVQECWPCSNLGEPCSMSTPTGNTCCGESMFCDTPDRRLGAPGYCRNRECTDELPMDYMNSHCYRDWGFTSCKKVSVLPGGCNDLWKETECTNSPLYVRDTCKKSCDPECRGDMASRIPISNGHLWSYNVETIFKYKSNDLTSMMQNGQQMAYLHIESPVHMVADVKVQAFSDKTLRVKLEHIKFFSNNNEITMMDAHRFLDMISPQNGRAVHGAQAIKASLEDPIMVLVKKGQAKRIVVAKNEPDCVSKVKMALVSHLMQTGPNESLQVVKKQAIINPIEIVSAAKKIDINV